VCRTWTADAQEEANSSHVVPGAEFLLQNEFKTIPEWEDQLALMRAELGQQQFNLAALQAQKATDKVLQEVQINIQQISNQIEEKSRKLNAKAAHRDKTIANRRVRALPRRRASKLVKKLSAPKLEPVIKREPGEVSPAKQTPTRSTPKPQASRVPAPQSQADKVFIKKEPGEVSPSRSLNRGGLPVNNERKWDFPTHSRRKSPGTAAPPSPSPVNYDLPIFRPFRPKPWYYVDYDRPGGSRLGPRELRYSESPKKANVQAQATQASTSTPMSAQGGESIGSRSAGVHEKFRQPWAPRGFVASPLEWDSNHSVTGMEVAGQKRKRMLEPEGQLDADIGGQRTKLSHDCHFSARDQGITSFRSVGVENRQIVELFD